MNVIAKFILVRCSYRPAESRQFYVSSIKKERFYIYLKKSKLQQQQLPLLFV